MRSAIEAPPSDSHGPAELLSHVDQCAADLAERVHWGVGAEHRISKSVACNSTLAFDAKQPPVYIPVHAQ